jgi:hypothetical protein
MSKVTPITPGIETLSVLTDWELEFQVNALKRACEAKGIPVIIAIENGGRQVIYKSRGHKLKALLNEAAKAVR